MTPEILIPFDEWLETALPTWTADDARKRYNRPRYERTQGPRYEELTAEVYDAGEWE